MSFVLFYFSGTGNTRYIARRICDTLSSRGYEAEAVSIEGLSVADARTMIDNSSAVGLGWPIYGSDVLHIMKDFCPKSAVTYGGKVKEPLYKGPDRETYLAITREKKA